MSAVGTVSSCCGIGKCGSEVCASANVLVELTGIGIIKYGVVPDGGSQGEGAGSGVIAVL